MISLDSVTKVYPGNPDIVALDNISLNIAEGEIHGIVGESGAGKSTLIRCLTALERPTSGRIEVDGVDLASLRATDLRAARRKIGMVFQGGYLFDSRTALENIAYPLKITGVSKDVRNERAQELLELVGLPGRGDAYPSQLSGGQRQRIAIARALAARPPVVLCDEPTSALDPATTNSILDLLAKINRATGVTVLIITHEMDVVRRICTNVTLLDNGRIAQSSSVDDAVSDVTSALGQGLVPTPSADTAVAAPGTAIIDVAFSARPGQPAASEVLALAASYGADVTAGRFETVGHAQAARLVMAVPTTSVQDVLSALQDQGVHATERRPA